MKTYIFSSALAAVLMSAAGAAGGSGVAKTADAMAKEVADANKKAEGNAYRADVLSAVVKLKHTENGDWQDDGRPSLKRVIALAGNNTITREDIDAAAPDLRRETVKADKDKASAEAIKRDQDENAPEVLDNVLVRAKEIGQYGGKLRAPGETFIFSGKRPSWLVPMKGKDKAAHQRERERLADEQDGDD